MGIPSSPISSRKIVPLCASWKRPGLSWVAPVKEPLRWPNSSLSIRVSGMPPQLIATNGWPLRSLSLWIARAISSLPVPLSPVMRTLVLVRDTCRIIW